MVNPVNLNVPGLDYPSFAIVFCGVVALFTLVLPERRSHSSANGGRS